MKNTLRSRIVEFFRAGYPTDVPETSHIALLAVCPAAAGVVGRAR